MQILELIDQLDNLVYEAKALPFGSSVRIDPEQIYALLDQMRVVAGDMDARESLETKDDAPGEDESGAGLKRVAETLDALEEPGRHAPPPLTAAAGDRVRAIVETAERTAAELLEEADEKARGIVSGAAELMADAKEAKKQAEADAEAAKAEAAEVKARAEVEAARVLERAERIRTETAASAAKMARDQLDRMDAAAAELEASASRAGAEFEELLDKLRAPAAELADAMGPAAQALRGQVETLSGRVAAADAPLRGLGGAPVTAAAPVIAEPVAPEPITPEPITPDAVLVEPVSAEVPEPAKVDDDDAWLRGPGDSLEFSFEGLPGAGDRIRAERVEPVEFADAGVADADDPTDPPEFELEEA